MNAIQSLFAQGQLHFSNGHFEKAYLFFEQCTQIMPSLSAAWENMAVCLANKGLSKVEIQQRLLSIAPKVVHSSVQQKISSLHIRTSSGGTYLLLIQKMMLEEAVEDFYEQWVERKTSDDESIQFVRALFIAHEHLAKKKGVLYLPHLLNHWKDLPVIQHCIEVAANRIQSFISRHKQSYLAATDEDIELLETLGLVHYTYTNYEHAAFFFTILCSLSLDIQKQNEYRQHLSTCYSLNAKYKEALEIDEDNITAWERYDPCHKKAFRAQSIKLHKSAKRIGKICLPYWPAGLIHHQDESITIAKLEQSSVCGHDPMIFDDDFVYAGNRGTFRLASPNENKICPQKRGIVVFATNPNNYYHLLIEFSAKLLSANQYLPADIPVYIPTSTLQLVQQMVSLLGLKRRIESFSVHDNLLFEELYVVDVRAPGHFDMTQRANVWDCYLSQDSSIVEMANRLVQSVSVSVEPRVIIYAKRGMGARSFDDSEDLIEDFLKNWAKKKRLELVIFEGKYDLCAQIELFGRCRVLFGIHGAGFTNLIFTPEDCSMVEIPIHGNCNRLFQELSVLMNRQHVVCDLSCEYQGSLTVTQHVLEKIQLSFDAISVHD